MNIQKLKEAEANFLSRYPGGFSDPEMAPIRKKHNVDKLIAFAQENLGRVECSKPDHVAETLLAIVSRSSMVSRFEKPRFKDFINTLGSNEREALAFAVEQRLHGSKKRAGFEAMNDMMSHYKIGKWTTLSAVPFYFAPKREVFVKPTTAKDIIKGLEIENLTYQSTPTWAFYEGYRKVLREVKKEVHASLAPNYAALSGFLMMNLER